MARVVKAPEAELDLFEIWAYIADDSFEAADRVADQLDEVFQLLATQPEMGRVREDLAPGLRYFPAANYLIFYRILPGRAGIEVVHVYSGRRDIEGKFGI